MRRILILFGSFDGQAARIAARVGATLASAGYSIDLRSVDAPDAGLDIDGFDALVVGGAVRFGRFARPLEKLVRTHATQMASMPNAFFSVCLSARRSDGGVLVARCVDGFRARTGWTPQLLGNFAGALLYRKYNPLLRLVMKFISARAGGDTDTSRDYEYTDWQAVDRFAADFARKLDALSR